MEVADIRLRAAYEGDFELLCARCVEPVATPLGGNFDLLFRPQAADADAGERSITPDETEIGYYEESGLSLEDVVREQVLLSLPSRTLCKEDCKGLCPRCGQNLNLGSATASLHDGSAVECACGPGRQARIQVEPQVCTTSSDRCGSTPRRAPGQLKGICNA